MDDEDFIDLEDTPPAKGQYCEIKVVSYFRGWYLPDCTAWSWIMDEKVDPVSHVEKWRHNEEKEGSYYELH